VRKTKFIFVTGGVVSSLGKGLASASMGALLEARGLRVTMQKLDPTSTSTRTIEPFRHGGLRHRGRSSTSTGYLTLHERPSGRTTAHGQIYDAVINKERKGYPAAPSR
jgi:CTP synthase